MQAGTALLAVPVLGNSFVFHFCDNVKMLEEISGGSSIPDSNLNSFYFFVVCFVHTQ